MTIMSATFDSLGYFERLKGAGFTEKQAKVQAEAMREIIDAELATKKDLRELEYRLTIRMGAMTAGGVALLAAFITLAR